MKKSVSTILAVLTAINVCVSQQSQVNGAIGVPFGSTQDTIKKIVQSTKPELKFYEYTGEMLNYTGGSFGGYSVVLWMFKLSQYTGFHTAVICLEHDESDTYDVYDKIVSLLKEKYGDGQPIEQYDYPYSKEDKYKYASSMFKMGKCTMSTYWKFPNESRQDKSNWIMVTIDKTFHVSVTYQDGTRVSEAIQSKNQKSLKDM